MKRERPQVIFTLTRTALTYAIEGITSPDGRVFGKMGHSERYAADLYKNVPGNYDIKMFKAAVEYFKS